MEVKTFFFDTYAFFEILAHNPRYQPFTKDVGVVTTKLNLMELHYGLLRLYGREVADQWYDRLVPFVTEVTDAVIKAATTFRFSYKERELSYVDCLGYIIAQLRGIRFLTGDRMFKDLPNVEFVE